MCAEPSDLLLYMLAAQSCPTLCTPMDCKPARFLCPWDFPGKNTRVGCHSLPQGDFPSPGMELWPPALWADYLLSETQGKSTLLLIEYNKNDGISLPRLTSVLLVLSFVLVLFSPFNLLTLPCCEMLYEKAHIARNWGQPLASKPSRNWGLNSSNSHVSDLGSACFPSWTLRWDCRPASTMTAA